MPISSEQQQVILAALEKKKKGSLQCPLCGAAEWEISDFFAMHPATDVLPDIRAGRHYPSATLLCKSCGYSMFFNLYRLGIYEELSVAGKEESSSVSAQ